jgi:exonuclease III
VKSSIEEIRQLCSDNDIVFLQETWLASDELSLLSNIHIDFYSKGTSAIDVTSGTLTGRPHGGVAILWRKTLLGVNVIDLHDARLIGISVTCGNKQIALLNVYLPVDSSQNMDNFMFYLSKIGDFIDSHPTPYVAVIGDFNTNLLQNSHSVFRSHLLQYCQENNLLVVDQRLCSNDTFTFFSEAHHSVSWLDHIVTNLNMVSFFSNITVDYGYISSDHFPLCAELNVPVSKIESEQCDSHSRECNIRWDKLSEHDLSIYKNASDESLKNIKLPLPLLLCDDDQCTDERHLQQINSFYKDIIESLRESGDILAQMGDKHRNSEIPGWNDYCKQLHTEAREAFLNWVSVGKPRAGPIHHFMQKNSRSV